MEKKATPKEGLPQFYKNFGHKFKVPYVGNSVSEILVRLRFVVETDGSFTNFEILEDENNIGDEAIRVLKSMPNWIPAQHEGKAVRSKLTLPIKIRI